MLRILSEKKRRHFYEQYENTQQVALLEGKNIDGKMTGFTQNYIKIAVDYDEALINQLIPVQLDKLTHREDELMLDASLL
jgi:threonylcarbamoyladenosine tRNA methylthiotransferase MtaB